MPDDPGETSERSHLRGVLIAFGLYAVGVLGLFLGLSFLNHPWLAGVCLVIGGVCVYAGFSRSLGEEE